MEQLPEILNQTQNSKKNNLIIAGLLFLLVSIPLGVYLVSQRTQFLPQAQSPSENIKDENILTLTSDQTSVKKGDKLTIKINLKSEQVISLIEAKLKFPQDLLEAENIASSSAQNAPKWVDSSFDNNLGEINLVGGFKAPGQSFSNIQDGGQITFIAKNTGQISLTFGALNIYNSEFEKQNVLKPEFKIIVEGNPDFIEASPSATPTPDSENEISLKVTNPILGQVYSYFKPIDITWQSQNIDTIQTISILSNNQNIGKLAQNRENSNKFLWEPQSSLPLIFITKDNYFQLQIEGTSKEGIRVTSTSEPFGLSTIGKNSTPSTSLPADFNDDSVLDTKDLFDFYQNYGLTELKNPKFDLNNDGSVGILDLMILSTIFKNTKL